MQSIPPATDILSNFGETLSELMFDAHMTPEALSKAIGADLSATVDNFPPFCYDDSGKSAPPAGGAARTEERSENGRAHDCARARRGIGV